MGVACNCNRTQPKYQYQNQTHAISPAAIKSLRKFALGAAARHYTRKMILKNIENITQMRTPVYEGASWTPVLKGPPMVEDLVLEDILNKPENRNLVWNNYFEPIGDAREY